MECHAPSCDGGEGGTLSADLLRQALLPEHRHGPVAPEVAQPGSLWWAGDSVLPPENLGVAGGSLCFKVEESGVFWRPLNKLNKSYQ